MTLDETIRRNPYDPKRGNEAAYCRYLRYNVDGWYQLDSKEVLRRWQKVRNMDKKFSAEQDVVAVGNKSDYERGLNDAWECVGKMERLLYSDVFSNVFGNTDFYTVVTKMSASEAMTKIKEYEEIHVGDEIIFEDKKYIVINIHKYVDDVVIVNETDVLVTLTENVKKTGRKYPVVEMLEGLKNDGE